MAVAGPQPLKPAEASRFGLARLLRHRWWWDERRARSTFPAAALQHLEAQVVASEQRHDGQIRVCVEAGLPLSYLWQGLRARDRAITLFGKLRVWDTEANNGVLVYLLLADRAIEIVADRGLKRHVSDSQWQAIVAAMQADCAAGRHEAALAAAIAAVDALLVQHFPRTEAASPERSNELPDAVILL